MTLIQAAAELADLYDLDLVPWADKAPTSGKNWKATGIVGEAPTDEDYNTEWGKAEYQYAELDGHARFTGERLKSIRSLHKTYLDRLDAMRQKGINAQLSDSTYEWAYGKKRRRRKK
jgi:hypothetical protein